MKSSGKKVKAPALIAAASAVLVWSIISAGPVIASGIFGSDLARAPGINDPSYSGYGSGGLYGSCGECTYILAAAPVPSAKINAAGLATRASVRNSAPHTVNVRIYRQSSGVVFNAIGESGFQAVGAGIATIGLPNIPVLAGDFIGVSGADQSSVPLSQRSSFVSRTSGAFSYFSSGAIIPIGVNSTYSEANGDETLVNVFVDDDLDADGKPDEIDDDLDNDGLLNTNENKFKTDVRDKDSDDDGIQDGDEDRNKNGKLGKLNKRYKKKNSCRKKGKYKKFRKSYLKKIETHPRKKDSDKDGLSDGLEIGVTAGIPAVGAIKGTDDKKFKKDKNPKTVTNPRSNDTDGDKKKEAKEDRNKDGKLQKKKREKDPNKPNCKKKKRR